MKTLVIFYTSCLILLYTTLTFLGYRKEKFGSVKNGVLPEVVVTAHKPNKPESELLSAHFDKALIFLEEKKDNKAAEQIYQALMVFTIRSISAGTYDKREFRIILSNLSNCYINLKLHRSYAVLPIDKAFEGAELFIAEDYILKSSKALKENNFKNALENINQAEECLVLATKYSSSKEIQIEKNLFKSSENLLNRVIDEMKSA